MTLDDIEKLATAHADLTDPLDPYPAELVGQFARALFAVMPVARHAAAEHDKWNRTGAPCTCAVCLAVDEMRRRLERV